MEKLFKDAELQKKFEDTKVMMESVRKAVAMKTDLTDPISVLTKLNAIVDIQYLAAECKARFQYLLDKHTASKLQVTDTYQGSATEKKVILNAEIAGVSFYDTWCECLLKECHYMIDILRTALSYSKQEQRNL
jgi:hypothetical protein